MDIFITATLLLLGVLLILAEIFLLPGITIAIVGGALLHRRDGQGIASLAGALGDRSRVDRLIREVDRCLRLIERS